MSSLITFNKQQRSNLVTFNNGFKVMLKAGLSREELRNAVNSALSILD